MKLDEETKLAFEVFKKKYVCQNYWETNNWEKFQKYLVYKGFIFINSGTCSLVYKHPKSKFVIKFNHNWDNCIGFWTNDNKLNNFLKYHSFCKHCAIQLFVDCSKSAQNIASNSICDIKSNLGLYNGKPVLVDSY